jgi:radical SAM superfamily enzyme YgiQ (UPF0313 family)
MKILLVLPTLLDRNGNPIRRKKASLNLNLNLPLLAGYVPEDIEVEIANDYVHTVSPDTPCDLVGISTTVTTAPRSYELADAFRARGKKVVLGGFHATAMSEEALEHCDSIVMGEADDVWPEVIDDFRHGTLKPIYSSEGFPDIQNLPVPRYHLVNRKDFHMDVYPAESSRGCPFDCDYCAVTKYHGGGHRLRPIGQVIRDIKATNCRFIAFNDDNIIGHKEHAKELFRALIPLNIRWMAQTTMYMADDPELIDLAVKSGCRFVWIGVESINPAHLSEVHRKINQVDQFERRIKEFQKRGVIVGANMLFGFDGEDRQHYEDTYQFLARNKVFPFLYVIIPLPGTVLFEKYKKEGRLLHEDWSRYSAYETVVQPKNFTPQEQDDLYWTLAQRIFTFKHNFLRSFPNIRMGNLKEDFFIALGAFSIGTASGRFAKGRIPTNW